MRFTRRDFLATATTALGGSLLPLGSAFGAEPQATARFRRYDVASPEGQRMLVSYARGISAMLRLPAEHPHNWFRNAFVHMIDCPHGNWWFYVWHRGYIGYFERTIRRLSGDPGFTIPFWDWTRSPRIPAQMFDGVLSPTDAAYSPITGNLAKFTAFIKPAMQRYWNTLNAQQRSQLDTRGYTNFDLVWNDVTGYSPAQQVGVSGNMAYAITCGARYLSRDNPHLDPKTTYDVSPYIVDSGLKPTQFYNPDITQSFTSSKTATHLVQPDGSTKFSILEGFPHNKVHNCIGGVGAIDPGPYGNMTNFLSPVDPVFYLHHANMDRLWHVWTQNQIKCRRPIAPTGDDLALFMNEPFRFFVDGEGNFVTNGKAADYFSTSVFDYDYAPGFGNPPACPPRSATKSQQAASIDAAVDDEKESASLTLSKAIVQRHVESASATLIAEITLDRPEGLAVTREFDVLVNAPDDIDRVEADSPHYAGTLAFFGPTMPGMEMSHAATFALPLPRTLQAFAKSAAEGTPLNIRLVSSGAHTAGPPNLRALTIRHSG